MKIYLPRLRRAATAKNEVRRIIRMKTYNKKRVTMEELWASGGPNGRYVVVVGKEVGPGEYGDTASPYLDI